MFRLTDEIEEKLELFSRIECKEIRDREKIYSPSELALFERLFKDEFIGPYYKLGHKVYQAARKNGFRSEFKELFEEISRNKHYKILDAGCGTGAQSILCAMIGGTIIGVDLITDRLNLAKKRKAFYQQQTGRSIGVEFINTDIFRIIRDIDFNVIWLREAISHIHPLEDFLSVVHSHMGEKGKIIICEMNWSQPLTKYKIYRDFWKYHRRLSYFTHTEYVDPQTGDPVEMAEERMFTLGQIKKMLTNSGFDIVTTRRLHFLPKTFLSRMMPEKLRERTYDFFSNVEYMLGKIPVASRFLALRNVVVGSKGNSNHG